MVSLRYLLILITLCMKSLKLPCYYFYYYYYYYYLTWVASSIISFIQYLCNCQGEDLTSLSVMPHVIRFILSLQSVKTFLGPDSAIKYIDCFFQLVSSGNVISNDDHYFHVFKSLIKMMNRKEQTAEPCSWLLTPSLLVDFNALIRYCSVT